MTPLERLLHRSHGHGDLVDALLEHDSLQRQASEKVAGLGVEAHDVRLALEELARRRR